MGASRNRDYLMPVGSDKPEIMTEEKQPKKRIEQLFTPYPHNWHKRLLPIIDSLSEMKVTEVIMRQTFGWQDKAEDVISFTQFGEMTGLSRPMVKQGIDAGVARGSIVRRKVGLSFAYWVDLDAEYNTKKKSGRGAGLHSNQLPDSSGKESKPIAVKSLNQFPDSSGKESKPIAVKSLNQLPASSGKESKHTKESNLKKLIKKVVVPPPDPFSEEVEIYNAGLARAYEKITGVVGMLSGGANEIFNGLVADYGSENVCDACAEAAKQHPNELVNLKYLEKILERWELEGKDEKLVRPATNYPRNNKKPKDGIDFSKYTGSGVYAHLAQNSKGVTT